jgi:AraC-like DNA-binding protein
MLVCIFSSAMLLLDWREQRIRAKARLFVFMLVAAALYGGHFIFFNHLYELMPVTDTIYCMANLAVFPLYYLYIKEVTEDQWQKHWQVTLLLPSLLAGLVVGPLYCLMDEQETLTFIDTFLYHGSMNGLGDYAKAQAIVHIGIKFLFALLVLPILVKGVRKIKHFNRMVETNYADTELRKIYMAKTILILFIVACIVSFSANILGRDFFDNVPWLVVIPSLTFSMLLFLLGYAGHRQNFTIENLMLETTNEPMPTCVAEPQTEEEKKDRIGRVKTDITGTVEKERLYLQQDLKINDIAKLLHTNRDYIYQAINVRMGMSFSEYINRLRVDFATQLMDENPKMPSNEIALRSGFSSVASFYRNFKLYKGCPPASYKKEQTTPDETQE